MKQPDIQVAKYLHQVKLTEKLDDRTVETLQSLGAGPKTVGALREMVDSTASMPVAAASPAEAGLCAHAAAGFRSNKAKSWMKFANT